LSAPQSAEQSAAQSSVLRPGDERERLRARCRTAVERAIDAGADEAEACASANSGTSVQLEKGDLQLARVKESESLGLRVFVGGRIGFASTNQASSDTSLAQLARDAVTLAKLSPVDPSAGLLSGSRIDPRPFLDQPRAWDIGPERVVDWAADLLGRIRAFDRRISVDQGAVNFGRGSSAVFSSIGADAAESDAGLSASLFGMAIDGDEVGGFDSRGDYARNAEGFEARLERLAREFGTTVLANLGTGRAQTYKGAVLLAPAAVLDLLVEPLVGALSALAVQRGRSAMAGKLGEAIAASAFDLVDDPTDPELAGATGADREGAPAVRTPLVEAGVLATYLYNARAARIEGRASGTGHAVGGPRGVPGIGPHALVLGPAKPSDEGQLDFGRDELAPRLGRGLLVGRFSGTVDPTSGDFSGVAKSARWIEAGAVTGSVGETLIAGNAYEALRAIAALSSRTALLGGRCRMPWALVDGVSVTAG